MNTLSFGICTKGDHRTRGHLWCSNGTCRSIFSWCRKS